MYNIKCFGYPTKIVSTDIVYDLDNWPRNPINNFTLKNCLYGANNLVKNSDKSKYVYRGYGIAFDEGDAWSFGHDFVMNIVVFGVDNSSSSHTDNRKNDI